MYFQVLSSVLELKHNNNEQMNWRYSLPSKLDEEKVLKTNGHIAFLLSLELVSSSTAQLFLYNGTKFLTMR